jgi:hypothetical protein
MQLTHGHVTRLSWRNHAPIRTSRILSGQSWKMSKNLIIAAFLMALLDEDSDSEEYEESGRDDDSEEEDNSKEDEASATSSSGASGESYDHQGMLWSESDEDNEDEDGPTEPKRRNMSVAVGRYAEDVVPRQSGDQFREHFRMSRSTFENLQVKLQPLFEKDNWSMGRPPMGVHKTMLIGLWLLANHEPHRSVISS